MLDVVEAGASDVAVRERLDASLHFSEDFRRVVATVHRQLPHDPVSVVVVVGVDGGVQTGVTVTVSVGVRRVLEFEARSPAVVQQVLNLLGQVGVRERRQEGEGLEHPVGVGEKGREELVSKHLNVPPKKKRCRRVFRSRLKREREEGRRRHVSNRASSYFQQSESEAKKF